MLEWALSPLRQFPLMTVVLSALLAGLAARGLFAFVLGMISARTRLPWRETCERLGVQRWLTVLVVGAVLHVTLGLWSDWSEDLVRRVRHAADLVIVVAATMAVMRLLAALHEVHATRAGGERRSFKAVVQVLQLLAICVALLLVLARLTNQPPALVLSGLGAAAALGAFVFKDVLLSFLAGMRILSDDIVRVGDWIETANGDINGRVTEIDLHDVAVANFDGSPARIGTRRLLGETFRNWRGMRLIRSRRICFTLLVDPRSIRFGESPTDIPEAAARGRAGATRLGEFRQHAMGFIGANLAVDSGLPVMARTLDATPEGVPVECSAFTRELGWEQAEALRSALLEHLLAVMPQFDLVPHRKGGG